MNEAPLISIIIPTWNSENEIEECLISLNDLIYPKEKLELIIVDNYSQDKTIQLIKTMFANNLSKEWKKTQIIEMKSNIGIPGAYNEGYKQIDKNSYAILRTETDVIFNPNYLEVMLNYFKDKTNVIAGSLIKHENNEFQSGAIFLNKWKPGFKVIYPEKEMYCDTLLGCAMLIKNDFVKELTYFFDESFFISGDELDLCLRARIKNYNILYIPYISTLHKGGRSTGKVKDLSLFYNLRNNVIICRKYDSFFPKVTKLMYNFIYAILKSFNNPTISQSIILGFLIKIKKNNI